MSSIYYIFYNLSTKIFFTRSYSSSRKTISTSENSLLYNSS